MKKNKELEKYTSEELADAFVLTGNFSEKAKEKANADLAAARAKVQTGMSEKDKLESKILQFKLSLNHYLKRPDFEPAKNFGYFLSKYIELTNVKQRTFAREIDLQEAELSQIINSHRQPSEQIFVRLEIHSNKSIHAEEWLRLVEKERVFGLQTNKALRREQKKHVNRHLDVSI